MEMTDAGLEKYKNLMEGVKLRIELVERLMTNADNLPLVPRFEFAALQFRKILELIADLLVFRGKIEGKSTFTRGVFIALNGISAHARDAITRGKAPSFFVMDGHDLMMVLSEAIGLPDFLRCRVRLLAEEGRVCVPFSELI